MDKQESEEGLNNSLGLEIDENSSQESPPERKYENITPYTPLEAPNDEPIDLTVEKPSPTTDRRPDRKTFSIPVKSPVYSTSGNFATSQQEPIAGSSQEGTSDTNQWMTGLQIQLQEILSQDPAYRNRTQFFEPGIFQQNYHCVQQIRDEFDTLDVVNIPQDLRVILGIILDILIRKYPSIITLLSYRVDNSQILKSRNVRSENPERYGTRALTCHQNNEETVRKSQENSKTNLRMVRAPRNNRADKSDIFRNMPPLMKIPQSRFNELRLELERRHREISPDLDSRNHPVSIQSNHGSIIAFQSDGTSTSNVMVDVLENNKSQNPPSQNMELSMEIPQKLDSRSLGLGQLCNVPSSNSGAPQHVSIPRPHSSVCQNNSESFTQPRNEATSPSRRQNIQTPENFHRMPPMVSQSDSISHQYSQPDSYVMYENKILLAPTTATEIVSKNSTTCSTNDPQVDVRQQNFTYDEPSMSQSNIAQNFDQIPPLVSTRNSGYPLRPEDIVFYENSNPQRIMQTSSTVPNGEKEVLLEQQLNGTPSSNTFQTHQNTCQPQPNQIQTVLIQNNQGASLLQFVVSPSPNIVVVDHPVNDDRVEASQEVDFRNQSISLQNHVELNTSSDMIDTSPNDNGQISGTQNIPHIMEPQQRFNLKDHPSATDRSSSSLNVTNMTENTNSQISRPQNIQSQVGVPHEFNPVNQNLRTHEESPGRPTQSSSRTRTEISRRSTTSKKRGRPSKNPPYKKVAMNESKRGKVRAPIVYPPNAPRLDSRNELSSIAVNPTIQQNYPDTFQINLDSKQVAVGNPSSNVNNTLLPRPPSTVANQTLQNLNNPIVFQNNSNSRQGAVSLAETPSNNFMYPRGDLMLHRPSRTVANSTLQCQDSTVAFQNNSGYRQVAVPFQSGTPSINDMNNAIYPCTNSSSDVNNTFRPSSAVVNPIFKHPNTSVSVQNMSETPSNNDMYPRRNSSLNDNNIFPHRPPSTVVNPTHQYNSDPRQVLVPIPPNDPLNNIIYSRSNSSLDDNSVLQNRPSIIVIPPFQHQDSPVAFQNNSSSEQVLGQLPPETSSNNIMYPRSNSSLNDNNIFLHTPQSTVVNPILQHQDSIITFQNNSSSGHIATPYCPETPSNNVMCPRTNSSVDVNNMLQNRPNIIVNSTLQHQNSPVAFQNNSDPRQVLLRSDTPLNTVMYPRYNSSLNINNINLNGASNTDFQNQNRPLTIRSPTHINLCPNINNPNLNGPPDTVGDPTATFQDNSNSRQIRISALSETLSNNFNMYDRTNSLSDSNNQISSGPATFLNNSDARPVEFPYPPETPYPRNISSYNPKKRWLILTPLTRDANPPNNSTPNMNNPYPNRPPDTVGNPTVTSQNNSNSRQIRISDLSESLSNNFNMFDRTNSLSDSNNQISSVPATFLNNSEARRVEFPYPPETPYPRNISSYNPKKRWLILTPLTRDANPPNNSTPNISNPYPNRPPDTVGNPTVTSQNNSNSRQIRISDLSETLSNNFNMYDRTNSMSDSNNQISSGPATFLNNSDGRRVEFPHPPETSYPRNISSNNFDKRLEILTALPLDANPPNNSTSQTTTRNSILKQRPSDKYTDNSNPVRKSRSKRHLPSTPRVRSVLQSRSDRQTRSVLQYSSDQESRLTHQSWSEVQLRPDNQLSSELQPHSDEQSRMGNQFSPHHLPRPDHLPRPGRLDCPVPVIPDPSKPSIFPLLPHIIENNINSTNNMRNSLPLRYPPSDLSGVSHLPPTNNNPYLFSGPFSTNFCIEPPSGNPSAVQPPFDNSFAMPPPSGDPSFVRNSSIVQSSLQGLLIPYSMPNDSPLNNLPEILENTSNSSMPTLFPAQCRPFNNSGSEENPVMPTLFSTFSYGQTVFAKLDQMVNLRSGNTSSNRGNNFILPKGPIRREDVQLSLAQIYGAGQSFSNSNPSNNGNNSSNPHPTASNTNQSEATPYDFLSLVYSDSSNDELE